MVAVTESCFSNSGTGIQTDKSYGKNMNKLKYRRVLLVEANNQRRWIGNRVDQELHIPPLGLMALATHARTNHPDLDIKIIESSLDTPTGEAYLACLESWQPDLVGIRGISFFMEEFSQIAAMTKEWKNVPVVGGGPIASVKKEALLIAVPGIDMVVIGEGELPFLSLLEGGSPGSVQGVLYRDNGRIAGSVSPQTIDDLDSLAVPDHGLVDLDLYRGQLSYAYNHRRQGIVTTGRGCPFHCTYCNTFAGKSVRLQSADKVFRDMLTLSEEHGVKDFYFVEDIFNISKRRTRDIFTRIIDHDCDWNLYFVNGIRADLMTYELIDLMVDAGTIWVTYGVESGSPKIQKLIRKNLNLGKAADIINYTQGKNIAVNINTMYGFPGETPGDARLTLDFLSGLHKSSLLPYHFGLRLFEGCDIVRQAERAGWNISEFLAENDQSYNMSHRGTPTFPREAIMDHVISYHELFGMENPENIESGISTLRSIGYSEQEIIDMYSILQNRPIHSIDTMYQLAG